MERELRLTIEQFEHILEEAELIDGGEGVSEVKIEPGELVITVVQ